MDSPIREEEVVSCLEPIPRVVNTIEEKDGGDRAPEGPGEGGETIKENDTNRSPDKSRDVIDDLHVDHRSTSLLPVVNILQGKTTNDGAGDQAKKVADSLPDVKTDEEPCPEDNRIEEEPDISTYRHASG